VPSALGTATSPIAGWQEFRLDVERAVREDLAAVGIEVSLHVEILGLQDERDSRKRRQPIAGAFTVYLTSQFAFVWLQGNRSDGCARCLARRWQVLQTVPVRQAMELSNELAAVARPQVLVPIVAQALAGLIGELSVRFRVENLAYSYGLLDSRVFSVKCLRDMECPDCGELPVDSPRNLVLPSSNKPSPDDHHSTPLGAIELDASALVNPVCGAIGYGFLEAFDLPSTAAVHGCFTTRTSSEIYEVMWGGHSNEYGSSRSIGMIEGLERRSGMSPRSRSVSVVASRKQLVDVGMATVDPRDCGLYSAQYYEESNDFVTFDDDLEISWVWGYSVVNSESILIPEDIAYYSTEHEGIRPRFVLECSNGCATGANLTEATYSGLMEVVERDAFLLAWYGHYSGPLIDGLSSRNAATRMMIRRLFAFGYECAFVDLSLTFGIPVVIAVSRNTDGSGGLCVGGGAASSVEAALASALDEIATDSLSLGERTRVNKSRIESFADDFANVRAIHDHSAMFGDFGVAQLADFFWAGDGRQARTVEQTASDILLRPAMDLLDDLEQCVELVAAQGFDVVVVEQTSPEQSSVGLASVSVTVPGLLPIDFGWARQRALRMPRLRTGLRNSGAIDHDLERAEFNLVPHPYP